jgi:hypothetical protein
MGGGGGGKGGAGQTASGNKAGNGGAGVTSLSGNAYVGGGGGGSASGAFANQGYNPPSFTAIGAGTVNTGGGGGAFGQAGGSGRVEIRYSDTFGAAAETTGDVTTFTSGGFRYYIFTSSGSIRF